MAGVRDGVQIVSVPVDVGGARVSEFSVVLMNGRRRGFRCEGLRGAIDGVLIILAGARAQSLLYTRSLTLFNSLYVVFERRRDAASSF